MSESAARLDRRGFLRGSLIAATAGALGIPGAANGRFDGAALAASPQDEADAFLARFVPGWLPLETAASEASWAASTDVSEEHTAAQVTRNLEVNRYVGAPEVIDTVRRLMEHKGSLNELTVRQLEKVRLRAAECAGNDSRGRQGPRRGRGQAVGHPGWLRLHDPSRRPGHARLGQRHRPDPGRFARPGRAPRGLGGVQDDRPSAPRGAASAPRASGTRSPRPWASTTSSRSRSPITA